MTTHRSLPELEREYLLKSRLAFKDFLDCLEIRRKALIDDYAPLFKGQRVLELGAHAGIFSESLLAYSDQVVLIENNPSCVEHLKRKFGKEVRIIQEDAHHELWKFRPGSFDIIVCAGLLYHSAYPYFMLEGMAHIKPQFMLLDTLLSKSGEIELSLQHPVNFENFRYNNRPDCGAVIKLSTKAIDTSLTHLGFKQYAEIDKSSLAIASDKDSFYFQEWKTSYSKWWRS